jgi:hypothetical protein
MTLRRAIGPLALAGSVAILLALGVWGVGHGGATHLDTPILYLGGKYWLAGGSPYTQNAVPHVTGAIGDTFERYRFAYPPQSAALFALLAVGSVETGNAIMTLLNLLSLGALSYVAVRLAGSDASELRPWAVPALVIGNLATVFVVWMGQTTLIVTAALAGAWYCARREHRVGAGVLLALATVKPPLSLFVVLWFVLEREWKVLAAMTVAILVMAVPAMYASGPVGAFVEWVHALGAYGGDAHNALGSRMLFNLQSLLWALGIATPNLLGIGVLATIATWWWRDALAEADVIGVLLGITLLFGYGHSYDVAALVALIPAFWRRVRDDRGAAAVALAMLFAISFPNSVLEPLGIPLLLHARVAVLCAALFWLLRLGVADARSADVVAAPTDDRRLGQPSAAVDGGLPL